MDVAAERGSDRGRRESELHQRRVSRDESPDRTESAPRILERAARVGDGRRELGKAEDESEVEDRDQHCRIEEPDGAGGRPAVAPAEVLAGYDEPDGEAPQADDADLGGEA